MKKYLFIILSIIVVGCKKTEKDTCTYFGGKIINPKSDYVLLCQKGKLVDSIPLSKNNTFLSKLKDIKPGLYLFKHGVEHQYVYLEPKDSLLVRLNTWGFDESLMFSGKGASRNNMLIETFLQNEKEKKEFYNYYQLNTEAFKNKVDSLDIVKNEIFNNFKLENEEVSNDFLSILKVALQYPLYTKSENFVRDNYSNGSSESLKNNFLTHRKETDINKEELMFYIPYRNYVYAHLYSDIYQQNLQKGDDQFTIALLDNINSKIKSTKQRNRLLRHITIRHFFNNSVNTKDSKIFKTFLSLSTDNRDKEHISNLIKDIEILSENKKMPSFTLLNTSGKIKNIKNIINNKKTVIYFRGKSRKKDEHLAFKLKDLIEKNEDTNFIVIGVNNKMHKTIKQLDPKLQYKLNSNSKAYNFLNSKFPRAILIDKNGIVNNNFTSLFSDKIESQIAGL